MNAKTIQCFWAKVNKTDSCWLWTASKRHKGYGAFVWADKNGCIVQGRAHRFIWEIKNGKIPEGMCVLHKCDTPACVNPEHLFLGTKAENNRDMCAKKRHVKGGTYCGKGKYKRGENHHNAKLTLENVIALRLDRRSGFSYSRLAKKYKINAATAYKIIKGYLWNTK